MHVKLQLVAYTLHELRHAVQLLVFVLKCQLAFHLLLSRLGRIDARIILLSLLNQFMFHIPYVL